ncbi:hypothetical protein [Paenibacillus silviterrae]|nr:hypothetical protein [Paenibacillus chinjuensis]
MFAAKGWDRHGHLALDAGIAGKKKPEEMREAPQALAMLISD